MKKTLCIILWLVLIGVAFAGPQLGGGKSGGGGTSTATLTGNTPNTIYGSNASNVQGWYNKILSSDDTRQFANSADSTKGVKIDASNQGAGQTGTIQAPINGTATLQAGTQAVSLISGTVTLATSAISSGYCADMITAAATGALSTDVLLVSFNSIPIDITGYKPTANGMLTIISAASTDKACFSVCNNTGAAVTPGAVTLNWRIVR
ncbi:MAG: hypothetical protein WC294_09065 [Methanoregula sp.]|jgi:hypothetical protein